MDPAAGRVPFAEWAERWYHTTAALRPSTRQDYRMLLDQPGLPAFAATTLAASTRWRCGSGWPSWSPVACRPSGPARPTRSCPDPRAAVEGGRLARNVAAGIKLPKVQRTEMHFLDADQVEALAEAIDAAVRDADPLRRLHGAAAE